MFSECIFEKRKGVCSPSHSKDWGKMGWTDEPALQCAIELVIIVRAERGELRNTVRAPFPLCWPVFPGGWVLNLHFTRKKLVLNHAYAVPAAAKGELIAKTCTLNNLANSWDLQCIMDETLLKLHFQTAAASLNSSAATCCWRLEVETQAPTHPQICSVVTRVCMYEREKEWALGTVWHSSQRTY